MLGEINDFLNNLIWGNILIYLLPALGIFFTVTSRFVQFRYFFKMFNILRDTAHDKEGHISSFQALMLSVAGRVGGGNIAGVAVAISLGGPGAVFWMWVIGLIGMSTSFFECSLAQLYKEKDAQDSCVYRGGPAYYVTKALGQKWLGIIISILLTITFGFAFNATQSYIITTSFESSFDIPTWMTAIVITMIFAFAVFGGVKRISKFSEVIVPVMAVGYLLLAIVVIALNVEKIPGLINMIVTEAFNPSSAIGGGIGAVLLQGAKRGMFSNEAGLGSAPNVAAVAYVAHPVQQGIVQSFSVFIDTIILCTCTAFIILLSGVYVPGETVQGTLLTQNALIEHIGPFGGYFVTVALFLFGLSSMLYNYYLAENSLNFFSKGNLTLFNIFRVLCLVLIMWGSFQNLGSIFSFADLSMGLLAVINLIVIALLYKPVLRLIKGYDRQLKEGLKKPVLRYNDYNEFKIDKNTWKEIVDNINDKREKE